MALDDNFILTTPISVQLLDTLETFLIERIGISSDGTPNPAMVLLQLLQAEREEDIDSV